MLTSKISLGELFTILCNFNTLSLYSASLFRFKLLLSIFCSLLSIELFVNELSFNSLFFMKKLLLFSFCSVTSLFDTFDKWLESLLLPILFLELEFPIVCNSFSLDLYSLQHYVYRQFLRYYLFPFTDQFKIEIIN